MKSFLISDIPKNVYQQLDIMAQNKGLSLENYLLSELKKLAERIELEKFISSCLKIKTN